MKKLFKLSGVLLLALSLLAGCTQAQPADTTSSASASSSQAEEAPVAETVPATDPLKIVVGATPVPHSEILNAIVPVLAAQGYKLEVKEFTDYVQPNLTLDSGDIDANFFQHQPYLDDFNAENGTKIVTITTVHYEPLGIYPGKTASLDDLADGAQVAVPNDTTNEARALLLLEAQGLIKINPDAGLKATVNDITENPKNLKIVELEAAQLARALQDVDVAVINGNYAIQAGLNAETDALAKEEKDSLAATTFANILAIREGDEDRDDLKALAAALNSEEVKAFIESTYQGAVVPSF